MKDKLLEYKTGLAQQLAEARKQMHMIEGALQFCEQLLSDIEEGEEIPPLNEDDET